MQFRKDTITVSQEVCSKEKNGKECMGTLKVIEGYKGYYCIKCGQVYSE